MITVVTTVLINNTDSWYTVLLKHDMNAGHDLSM